MSFKKAIYASTGLVLGMSGVNTANAAECPIIPINDLAKAVCSSPSKPYSTDTQSRVKFYATTPCPSQNIALNKAFQAVFKGKKDYMPTSDEITPGEVTCTYILDKTVQKALDTTDAIIQLSAELKTIDQVNYLVNIKCPAPTLSQLAHGGVAVKGPNSPYLFYWNSFHEGKHGNLIEKVWRKEPELPKLDGKMNITKDFKVTCKYTYKIGDKETPLVLEGSTPTSK